MKRHALRNVLSTLVLLLLLGSNTYAATAQGITDLSVKIVANRHKVKPGQTITYTVTVTNLGPDAAPLIDVIHSLPDQLQFVSLTCDRGVSNDGDFCEYLSLEAGARVVSTLVATPLTGTGMLRSKRVATTAIVSLESTATADPDQSNNTATVLTKLNGCRSHH